MFGSLFSDRYNKKRALFYAHYDETRQRFPNLPVYRRPTEPLTGKYAKRGRKKRKLADYDYDEWIAGNFVSIVVRRAIELWSCCQLMQPVCSNCIDVCSWRSWPSVAEKEDDEREREPRRSLRFTDRPNVQLKDMGSDGQLDANDAMKWQQRLLARNAKPTKKQEEEEEEEQEDVQQMEATFINGWCCHNDDSSTRQCNMCGCHFKKSGDLELHSLDDCRKYLLATLAN